MTTLEDRASATSRKTGVAQTLAEALRPFVGGDLPVELHAWDGSVAGSGPVVRLNSPKALTRLLWAPGELGAAQAYVTGELDVEGDLDAALTHVWTVIGQRGRRCGWELLVAVRPHLSRRRCSRAGCTARPATGTRSATTTTSPTSSTTPSSTTTWPTPRVTTARPR